MGIRFLCEQCSSRIHVKEFLAGRRAKCPQCQNKMTIPMESTISHEEIPAKSSIVTTDNPPTENQESSKSQSGSAKAVSESVSDGKRIAKDVPQPAKKSKTSADSKNGESPQAKAEKKATGKEAIAKNADAGKTSAKQSSAKQVSAKPSPRKVTPAKETEANSGAISETFQDVVPKQAAEKTAASNAEPAKPISADNGSPAEQHASLTQASAPPVAKPDLLEEDPNALWYVAPPSGGKYGPADAKMMRGWVEEGRVSADSLVWREGWDDWRSATVIMPTEIPTGEFPVSPVVPDPPQPKSTGGESAQSLASKHEDNQTETDARVPSSVRYHRARTKSKTMGILLIVGLAIISIALLVWLVIAVSTGP